MWGFPKLPKKTSQTAKKNHKNKKYSQLAKQVRKTSDDFGGTPRIIGLEGAGQVRP